MRWQNISCRTVIPIGFGLAFAVFFAAFLAARLFPEARAGVCAGAGIGRVGVGCAGCFVLVGFMVRLVGSCWS